MYGDQVECGLLGHPDKFARIIANYVTAGCIERDPDSSVDIHVITGPNIIHCAGNITGAGATHSYVSELLKSSVEELIQEIGYTPARGYDANCVKIVLDVDEQAPMLNSHKKNNHAGDSRPFSVYLSKDTPEFKSLPSAVVDDVVRAYSKLYDSEFMGVATQNGKIQAEYKRENGHLHIVAALQLDPSVYEDNTAVTDLKERLFSKVIKPAVLTRHRKEFSCDIIPFLGCLKIDTGDSSTKNGCGGIQPNIGGNPYGKNAKIELYGPIIAKELGISFLKNSIADRCFASGAWSIGKGNPNILEIDPLGAGVNDAELNELIEKYLTKTPDEIITRYGLRNPEVIRCIGRNGLFDTSSGVK